MVGRTSNTLKVRMLLIEHRVNTLEHLHRVPPEWGVEIDVRAFGTELCLAHDPFVEGEPLEPFLAQYRHALVIFNVKCDGLEPAILKLVERYGIRDYFFLDVANPTLVQLTRAGLRQVAVRYSEHEPIESALAFAGQADWVWVDCFTRLPLDPEIHARLAKEFKICLVSPELQRHPRERIAEFKKQLGRLRVDAVCSDFCQDWTC